MDRHIGEHFGYLPGRARRGCQERVRRLPTPHRVVRRFASYSRDSDSVNRVVVSTRSRNHMIVGARHRRIRTVYGSLQTLNRSSNTLVLHPSLDVLTIDGLSAIFRCVSSLSKEHDLTESPRRHTLLTTRDFSEDIPILRASNTRHSASGETTGPFDTLYGIHTDVFSSQRPAVFSGFSSVNGIEHYLNPPSEHGVYRKDSDIHLPVPSQQTRTMASVY